MSGILGILRFLLTGITSADKWATNQQKAVRPAKTQISLGIRPVWSVFTVRMKKAWVLSYPLSAQRRLWLDWVDAQADLSLRWAHGHIVGFVMLQLKKALSCHYQTNAWAALLKLWKNMIFRRIKIEWPHQLPKHHLFLKWLLSFLIINFKGL